MTTTPLTTLVRRLNLQAPGITKRYRETLAGLFFAYQLETDVAEGDGVIAEWAEKLRWAITEQVCEG